MRVFIAIAGAVILFGMLNGCNTVPRCQEDAPCGAPMHVKI